MELRHHSAEPDPRLGLASTLLSIAILGALITLASVTGCAADTGSEESDELGTLGVTLSVAPGVTINAVSYAIEGNGFAKSGVVNASGALEFSANIGGIPIGAGYTITLTATSVEGNTTFSGSAQFAITAGRTASVTVRLRGVSASGNGSVAVNGTINVGPVIDELTVSPLRVVVGSSVSLSSLSRDPDEWPEELTYFWSTTGGVISDPIAPEASLTSARPGTFDVTLSVFDGDITTSATHSVTFVDPDDVVGEAVPEHPNVLLIVIDDLGAAATSVYPELAGDSGAVPVPNIEALAENGLVFDNAWSSPACSPTRGTIVTGQYGFRTTLTNVGDVLPPSTTTIWDRLTADTTYTHAVFGKYHIGGGLFDPRAGVAYPVAPSILQHIRDVGITTFKGILGGALVDYFDWTPYDINAPSVPTRTYATTVLTDYAIDFIHQQEATNPEKPWFLYQAYNAPHAANGGNNPYQVPPAHLHHVDLSSVGNPAPGTYATNIPVYKANIQALDTELGRLLDAVDLETTTVIFIGDNGVPPPITDVGQGLRGSKGSVYEGGVRVPLIVAGAGVTRRGREDSLFVAPDLFATVLDLAGADVSHVNDSYSVKPLLNDASASSGRTHSYSEIGVRAQHRYAVRDARFKLAYPAANRFELYDLEADPLETTNLLNSAPHAAVLASLRAKLAAFEADASDAYFP